MSLKQRALSGSSWFLYWLEKLSWNDHEYRPSATLRLVFGIATFVIIASLGILVYGGGKEILSIISTIGIAETLLGRLIGAVSGQVVGSAAWVIGIIIAAWYLDRRYIRDLGFRGGKTWIIEFGFGILIGLGLQVYMLLVGIEAGWIAVTGTFTGKVGELFIPWLIVNFVFYVCIGIREEIIFRGYLMTNLAEGFSWFNRFDQSTAVWIAVVISSVFFSLWHTGSTFSFLIFAGCFGLLFGTTYALTGSIAIPVGLHTAWDWGETSLFASQTLPTNKLIETKLADPVMIIGGVNSMEFLSFTALILGMLLIAGWVRFREGSLTTHSEVAIPDLHDKHYRRIQEMFKVKRHESTTETTTGDDD